MTSDAVTPPRKKPSIFWWIGAVVLLLFGLFLYQLFGPNPKIIVSKQTTYITSPLRADGMPNYGQYLLESARNGIIPEDNAAPLMWRALGLDRIDAKDRAAFAAELGITGDLSNDQPLEPPYSAQTCQRVAAWLSEQRKLTLPGQTIDNDTIKKLLRALINTRATQRKLIN
ncbi:MAG: hypothetical protein U0805_08995 [Pirellulales bacterium]